MEYGILPREIRKAKNTKYVSKKTSESVISAVADKYPDTFSGKRYPIKDCGPNIPDLTPY